MSSMIKRFVTLFFIKTNRRKPDNRTIAEKKSAFTEWSRRVGPQERKDVSDDIRSV